MTNPVAMLRRVQDGDEWYSAILVWCPGCVENYPDGMGGGLNMLPISGNSDKRPTWGWNGKFEAVTLTPSILSKVTFKVPELNVVCHSYLTDGIWHFLNDCTHELVGQSVPMVPLPDWIISEVERR